MTIIIEYTKEQKQAIAQLRRAWNRLHKVGLGRTNNYGTLEFYPVSDVRTIDDTKDEVKEYDVVFEELDLGCGEWCDDTHWVHFTEKGKKKYFGDESNDD